MSDPLHDLQAAARRYARHVLPGVAARSLVIRDEHREPIAQVRIPPCAGKGEEPEMLREDRPGWDFSRKVPRFDGTEMPEIRGRNAAVLRLLAEADGPLGVDDLRPAWDGYKCSEGTIRNQVSELRTLLKQLWPNWEGDPVPGTGNGYMLEIR